jgi:hypothetical protein
MAKYYETEWSIPSHPDWVFRFKRVSPVTMMSISLALKQSDDMNSRIDTNETLINFALENIEYKVMTQWFSVKTKGEDIFYPSSLETDITAMMELAGKFLNEIFYPTFTKSDESQKTTK